MSIVTVTETESYTVDWKRLAGLVEQAVMEKMRDDLANWHNDLSMRQMLVQDAADGLAVCELLLGEDWTRAKQKLRDMDTASRDEVYDMIDAVAGADFFKILG